MGYLATVDGFTRTSRSGVPVADVQVTPFGPGSSLTPEQMLPAGVDSAPLLGDLALAVDVLGSGRAIAAAYADPVNAGVATSGEFRAYSRDAQGTVAVEIHLKADGSVFISNAAGSFELGVDGAVSINGAQITTLGDVISALMVSLSTHTHGGVTVGAGQTGAPIPS